MCGIFAYTGENGNSLEILLNGLKTLEYRGYDSAGIYSPKSGLFKAVGQVKKLEEKLQLKKEEGISSGIAHTRWATHGSPTENNCHPHRDCSGRIHLVHNGIIENYKELKGDLIKKGHTFKSETDSEVIAHLIEGFLKKEDTKDAIIKSLNKVRGTFGLVITDSQNEGKLFVARMGSPVVLGLGENQNFVASDPSAILKHTKDVIYLDDGELAILDKSHHDIFNFLDQSKVEKESEEIFWDAQEIQKSGYKHFMLKEIMEEADVLEKAINGRIILEEGLVKLGGLDDVKDKLGEIDRIIIVACGTASYAGMYIRYILEEYAGIEANIEIASEFRYRQPVLDKKTAVLAVSQSGETADTLACIKETKRRGVMTLGIVNVVGSSIARETDAGIYTHSGPEISVASTKAFISQITVGVLLAVFLGRQRNMSVKTAKEILTELKLLPEKMRQILSDTSKIEGMTEKYSKYKNFFFLGRKYNTATANEGSIKLKEIAYVHSESYPTGEMKHGPIALIDENFASIVVVPTDSVYDKNISNIQEIKARKGPVLAIIDSNDSLNENILDDYILVPKTIEVLSPILNTVPLHLFAYYFALYLGREIDKPRNLAKSVTVE
jgi:glucosamine--fructose-6-phosphate aminotransferase (isomerizing)